MYRKNQAIGMWIASIGYTCAMALCLMLMVTASVLVSFAGLSPTVGLVMASVGGVGCIVLIALGGAAMVSAATVWFMRRRNKPEPAKDKEEGKPAEAAQK